IIDYNAVARGGIEPPTHGFSVRKQYISLLFYTFLINSIFNLYYNYLELKLVLSSSIYFYLFYKFRWGIWWGK
ncbi:uncharacterized protein METZ01_LOCUS146213, partial [marine metagenome]